MTEPLIESLRSKHASHIISNVSFSLAAAYRTVVELSEFHHRMDGYDEMDRLKDVKEWPERALEQLFGEDEVIAWETEAKTVHYSPFA